jgi:hypothetical protein
VEELSNQLRVLDLVALVGSANANPDELPSTGAELAALMRRPLQVDLAPLKAITSTRTISDAARAAALEAQKARASQIKDLIDSFTKHRGAVVELTSVNSSHIVSMTQKALPALQPPSELEPGTSLLRQANLHAQLSGIT